MSVTEDRDRLVRRARRHLEGRGSPRLRMLGVLSLSIASGFLASVGLLRLGVDRMPVRYPIAVGAAYATYLGLLWSWLRGQKAAYLGPEAGQGQGGPESGITMLGIAPLLDDSIAPEPKRSGNLSSSDVSGLGNLFEIGDAAPALVVLLLIAGLCTLIVGLYAIVISPVLLAELLVDGVLLGAMSRAVAAGPAPHWSRSVLRRTWIAALVTAIVYGLVGFGFECVAPDARTLGEAWAADQRSP
ncbi:hypothetical protein TA3x_004074 [Tundrisphaera sp. TA3]|uniref:hypothetical protein n=1 Tax=Tundrisphaera sp. TA3 TaxID=3435775 RepID=UPI003EC0D078